jgi:hypothetical protein
VGGLLGILHIGREKDRRYKVVKKEEIGAENRLKGIQKGTESGGDALISIRILLRQIR